MKVLRWATLCLLLLAAGCQPARATVHILEDGETVTLRTTQRLPEALLREAGISLGSQDRLLYLGTAVPLDTPLPDAPVYTLLVRRAVSVTVQGPQGESGIQSSARTVGEALTEAGYTMHGSDRIDPPAGTPLLAGMTIHYRPARELTIRVDGAEIPLLSSAETVGRALAEAGLPLQALDYSLPPEGDPVPEDGRIRIVRVEEAISLTLKDIPYATRTELSADLEIDQRALLQSGEPGLAAARTRMRVEDGAQVSLQVEDETIIRPPQDRLLGIGTKIVIRTASVDGVTFEYWRAIQVYATYYVPCDANNVCLYGTSIGTRVRRGSVAMVYPWFLLFAHEPVYVPGYGFGIIEDTNGANTSAYWGTYWIDVGYAQDDPVDWVNGYVTLYFLTPVAANVADTYILP
jgi:uncharacterized protein YabE (DUF348 family)